MEETGLCLEVARDPKSLVRDLVHGAGAYQYYLGTVWAYRRATYCPTQKVSDELAIHWPVSFLQAEVVNYCKLVLEQSHTREDYKELISLCLIFLGGADPTEVSFWAPGAFHQARWMVKAIYILKLHLFQIQHQFILTSKEKNSVEELVLFMSQCR